MKLIFTLLFALGLGFTCLADQYQPEGESFQPPANAQVVWGIAITNLPSNLWVYQIYPQTFAMPVLTNLLAISKLQMLNRISKPSANLKSRDKNFIGFQDYDNRGRVLHYLYVAPTLGYIGYRNNFYDPKDPLEEAPTVEKLKELAFEDIFKAGIDRSLIATKPRAITVSTTQRGVSALTITNSRGAIYSRKVDGINERGFCFSVEYGTRKGNPDLLSFKVNWRNLVPFQIQSIDNTNDIIDAIKSGLAKAPPQPDDLTLLSSAKKLTITQFEIIYFSKPPMEKLDFEYPYAELTLVANDGTTNIATYYLNCPIIKDSK